MSEHLLFLIKRFEAAEQAVTEAIQHNPDIHLDALKVLDEGYRSSFERLTSQELSSDAERLERVGYLLKLLTRDAEEEGIAGELAAAILSDASRLLGNGNHNKDAQNYTRTPANTEHSLKILSMCS